MMPPKQTDAAKTAGDDSWDPSLDEVVITHDQIATALGIASKDTISTRIRKAVTAGLLVVGNPDAPRSVRRAYKVLIGSRDAAQQGQGFHAMPTPERVAELAADFATVIAGLGRMEAEDAAAVEAAAAEEAASVDADEAHVEVENDVEITPED